MIEDQPALDPLAQPAPAAKKPRRKPGEPKPPKVPKPKPARDLRSVFREKLAGITADKIKRPWMAEKVFRLVDTREALVEWARGVLSDRSRHHAWAGSTCPVVAVDTETTSLDTRIFTDLRMGDDGVWRHVYEVGTELAGVCLSADGLEGIYVPVGHEQGRNVSRADVAAVLQPLFDQSHLVFYNGKFDREVMRITLGINFRPYPHFEDVQVLKYINDPKADLGDKGSFSGDAGGLKALSETVLGIEQIEMSEVAKVRAHRWDPATQKNTLRQQVVPFTWLPPDLALWYAAADAICTWLLWDRMKDLARSRKLIHHIDHELVDSLAWVERPRFRVDVDRQRRTARWHGRKTAELREKLRRLALDAGWVGLPGKDGVVKGDPGDFNPGSPKQLGELLFKLMGFTVYRTTDTGAASTDKETLEELSKAYPDHDFLRTLMQFRELAALHPDNLRYDPRDNSARLYLKQNVVAGGRLSGAGGEFEKDGGLEWNPQGVKKLEPDDFWRVYGDVLQPDSIAEEDVEERREEDLHPSCFRMDGETREKAPGIIRNHIGLYQDYAICLVPGCESCASRFGVLIPDTSLDANQVVNLRVLFVAQDGWTFFSIDYSNIEVRTAANLSKEPKLEDIFLVGDGDHHALTASQVFPEYSDPTSKLYKAKSLRAIAKTINFALQYGGTEHAIYEALKKSRPDLTREKVQEMVAKYWAGVPKFKEWCDARQARAREAFVCETQTGRVINFKSAMEADRIHVPSREERGRLGHYYDLRREAKKAEADGDRERQEKYKAAAERLWKNPDTGVRNAIEYNKFLGYIQRVAVNCPVQGLSGDFMRIALNRIRLWVASDPDVQKVFRLHGSVHDEIDISIKNEYVPFVLPRLTRLMKLRKYHEKMGWRVPIECDAEYGRSWDVDYNVTDKKSPAAYTMIEGLRTYVPDDFDVPTVRALHRALCSGDEGKRARAKAWLEESVHPRAMQSAGRLLASADPKEVKQQLIAVLQLHEYWTIDHVPDADGAALEALAQYEARMGLTEADRDPAAPEFGYMGAIPLDAQVVRPQTPVFGDPPPEACAPGLDVPPPLFAVFDTPEVGA